MRNGMAELVARFRGLSRVGRWLLFAVAFLAGLMVVGRFTAQRKAMIGPANAEFRQLEGEMAMQPPESEPIDEADKLKDLPGALAGNARLQEEKQMTRGGGAGSQFQNPLIAHTAEIAVATREFAKSRSSLEEILERHRGYAAKLRMVGQRNGSLLSAMLRVPSSELSGTVGDLKTLGDVEREEQAADEITQQRADVEARLNNAQATLRRLAELLKKQTYPDGNVRELQRQIAMASAEVNRLEGERQASEHRVVFANVKFSLREEVTAPAETIGSQLRAAATAGFGDAAASVSALLVLVIGRGPVLLLWLAILYVPARFVWKKWQPAAGRGDAAVQAG